MLETVNLQELFSIVEILGRIFHKIETNEADSVKCNMEMGGCSEDNSESGQKVRICLKAGLDGKRLRKEANRMLRRIVYDKKVTFL